ncbi:zinc knuckle protein [Rutstroemia sp. NJR-2017a BBW]|nr:zinc knuckle protein [Rutstroemia sp. NJR-2017a BBW]
MTYMGNRETSTVYATELQGIKLALEIADEDAEKGNKRDKLIIFTDNQAAIRTFQTPAGRSEWAGQWESEQRRRATYKYPRTYLQGPPLTPPPKEMTERSAYPDANGEKWLERSPMEEEGSGIRRPGVRLRRRTTNSKSCPTQMPKLLGPTKEGFWHPRRNGLEGNLKRVKISH